MEAVDKLEFGPQMAEFTYVDDVVEQEKEEEEEAEAEAEKQQQQQQQQVAPFAMPDIVNTPAHARKRSRDQRKGAGELNLADNEDWAELVIKFGTIVVCHPIDYAKTLIQLGFEPLAQRKGTSWLGQPVIVYPNVLEYVWHIYSLSGFHGAFRGLSPKILGSLLGSVVSERIVHWTGLTANIKEAKALHHKTFAEYRRGLVLDLVVTTTSIVVAHPFHVISVRMMAQFVGEERVYRSIMGALHHIWHNEGLRGLFAGLTPKLIWNLGALLVSSSLVFMINRYLVKKRTLRKYSAGMTHLMCHALFFPLQTVGVCTMVSGSSLKAGKPPLMPVYSSWIECFKDMRLNGTYRRGSSLFLRSVSRADGGFNVTNIALTAATAAAAAAADVTAKLL